MLAQFWKPNKLANKRAKPAEVGSEWNEVKSRIMLKRQKAVITPRLGNRKRKFSRQSPQNLVGSMGKGDTTRTNAHTFAATTTRS